MKIKNPIPQTPELWLEEIARAFNDAADTIPFGQMTGSLITPDILFQLAPCACLKFRGVKITDKNLKDPTDAALCSYVVTKNNRPEAFTSPQIAFAFCYLASHMGCGLLDEEAVNSIMIYIEENEERLLDLTEDSLENLEDYAQDNAQEEDQFYGDIETCYSQMRETGRILNSRLTKMLGKGDIETAARTLGLMGKDNILVLGSEDEYPILMDYCIHSVLQDGKNLIDRCLEDKQNEFSSDEILYLNALTKSHYTMIRTETAEPGVGIHALDLFYDQDIFLADSLFSKSAVPDIMMAGRLIPFPNFYMTTGTMLPVLPESVKGMKKILKSLKTPLPDRMSKDSEDELSGKIISFLLSENSASSVVYGGPEDTIDELIASRQDHLDDPDYDITPSTYKRENAKVGRNEPCPCGSGKKYKKCCGKRQ